jgi:hypothetical protein
MTAELNYCKNCGAKLAKGKKEKDSRDNILNSLLTTLFLVVMFGLGILVGLVAVLLGSGVNRETVVTIAIVYLVGVFGICYKLLSQIPKLIDAKLKTKSETSEDYQPPQLSAQTTAQLEEHREPVMSVTDNTTRIFDKIPLREK